MGKHGRSKVINKSSKSQFTVSLDIVIQTVRTMKIIILSPIALICYESFLEQISCWTMRTFRRRTSVPKLRINKQSLIRNENRREIEVLYENYDELFQNFCSKNLNMSSPLPKNSTYWNQVIRNLS